MSKKRKPFGFGTLALIFGLLPTVFTTQINGVSILTMMLDAAQITLPTYAFAAGLLLSVPGVFIGWIKREDYGAKFGAVLCAFSAVFTVITAISLLIG